MDYVPDWSERPGHTAAYPWAAPDAPQFYDEKEYEPELDEVREPTKKVDKWREVKNSIG